jgi:hypothetical protein
MENDRTTFASGGLMEIEKYHPVCASCHGAEALGQARRRPPALARADYFFKDHEVRCAPAPPVRAQRCCAPRMRRVPWG